MSLDPSLTGKALNTLSVNIAVLDGEGTILWTNRAWQQFAVEGGSSTAPDMVGLNYLDVVDVDDENATSAREGLAGVLTGEGEEFTLEYPCHSPDRKQWFLMWAAPFEVDGESYATVAHFDVTDRVLAEQDIAEYAAEASEQRDQLALLNQLVRHDIRNDIQLVMSHAELLRAAVPEDDQHHVETVVEQAEHIVELTRAVRELEAVITGDEEPSLSPVNLGAVLQTEADKVRSAHRVDGRDVVVTGTDDLPSDTRVAANEMLSSVFGNLLSNAVIHNDSDQPRIEVGVERGDGWVEVTVADNGPGIPESDRETVFGRGEMGADSQGTGLGLYLVDRLVELYGGEVWISDHDSGGTVFHVKLRTLEDDWQ